MLLPPEHNRLFDAPQVADADRHVGIVPLHVGGIEVEQGNVGIRELAGALNLRGVDHHVVDAPVAGFGGELGLHVERFGQEMGVFGGGGHAPFVVFKVGGVGQREHRSGDGLGFAPLAAHLADGRIAVRTAFADQVFNHVGRDQQQQHQDSDRKDAQHDGVARPFAKAFVEGFGGHELYIHGFLYPN